MAKVLMITSWDTPCGIAEYAAYLIEAIQKLDPTLEINPNYVLQPSVLHPDPVLAGGKRADILHLNYGAAIHSQWTPAVIERAKAMGYKVVITYHDSGVPSSDQCLKLYAVADHFVVHEPVVDMPTAQYIRHGVPDWDWAGGFRFGCGTQRYSDDLCFKASAEQPVVGSIGFPFPWKNFDTLATASAAAGWAMLLIAPGASPEQIDRWRTANPHSHIRHEFLKRDNVLSLLTGCDATAFLYAGAMAATSGAIRQGIATRKPVFATHPDGCRQFSDLNDETAIRWMHEITTEGVAKHLATCPIQRCDAGIVELAARDSWKDKAEQYLTVYKELMS